MAGTFCGHTDPSINERGRAHVEELICRLAGEPFAAMYSSDLRRAMETAQPLAQALAIPCITTDQLREIHFGNWEGLDWEEIERRDADYARRWIESFPALPAPGGELPEAFDERVLEEVDRLLLLAEDKRIAVMTHGGVMRVVLRKLLGHTEERAWELTAEYCSSFEFAGATAGYITEERA